MSARLCPPSDTKHVKGLHAVYLYRKADSKESGPYNALPASPGPCNTRAGHDRLIQEWNNRDAGKYVWCWVPA